MPGGTQVQITAHGFGINLFKGIWVEGTEYLVDDAKSQQQTANSAQEHYLFELEPDEPRTLSQDDLNKMFGVRSTARLIFEGTQASDLSCVEDSSNCYLEVAIKLGQETIAAEKIYMNILPVKHYYDHYSVGFGELDTLFSTAENVHESYAPLYTAKNIFINEDPQVVSMADEYIMMVHGWRMKYTERVGFAETAFKRLYWSGYKGRFGFFSWPTGWFEKPAHAYGASQLPYVEGNQQNYGDSEALGRMVGPLLSNLLFDLSQQKTVHIFAHSMGNVVVSEALRNANTQLVADYIASQAAEVASTYNPLQDFIQHKDPVAGTDLGGPESAWRFYNADGLDTEYDMPPNHYSYTIPALHGPTSPDYEVATAAAESWGASYYANLGNGAGRVINFHNVQDAALTGWEVNQLTKPDYADGPTWDYEFNWDCPYSTAECLIDVYPDAEDGEQVTDVYMRDDTQLTWDLQTPLDQTSADIMGHIIPSRTNALGQVAGIGQESIVNEAVNLNVGSFGYDQSNQGHSAQFYYSYANRKSYWDSVLEFFELDFGSTGE